MKDPLIVIPATVALIVCSAFFVIIEFSLLAAKRHRLEAEASTHRSARAAIRGLDELAVMLAGAQLGITICTFALGAVTKPAVDAWLGPLLTGLGAPAAVADTSAFVFSLLFVTFLHLVVGEMAPKSWAIAHPEASAKATALPARAFVWSVRPVLLFANAAANRLVSASGVTPVDSAGVGGYDVEAIRQLVDHSASSGTLDTRSHGQLSGALDLESTTVADLLDPDQQLTIVARTGTVAEVHEAAVETGHLRILVDFSSDPGATPRFVHVRDTLTLRGDEPVGPLSRPILELDASTPLHEALGTLRGAGEQVVAVTRNGRFAGIITVSDLLRSLLPESHSEEEGAVSGPKASG